MDKRRLLAVANAIENETIPDFRLEMRDVLTRTCGCIAGYTVLVTYPTYPRYGHIGSLLCVAQSLLDITSEEADKLFCAYPSWAVHDKVHVAHVIRNFVDTGKIIWENKPWYSSV